MITIIVRLQIWWLLVKKEMFVMETQRPVDRLLNLQEKLSWIDIVQAWAWAWGRCLFWRWAAHLSFGEVCSLLSCMSRSIPSYSPVISADDSLCTCMDTSEKYCSGSADACREATETCVLNRRKCGVRDCCVCMLVKIGLGVDKHMGKCDSSTPNVLTCNNSRLYQHEPQAICIHGIDGFCCLVSFTVDLVAILEQKWNSAEWSIRERTEV